MARLGQDPDEVEGLDEEFLFHLNRGSELLSQGDAGGARGALEKALELRARDPKVLGLLGQACYRLGKYDDAIVAWQRLVDESPAEAAARVNLGLAFLRAKRQSQAIRQLEIALDLNPDHKKAMGYLGLALLESGDPQRAREWFLRAGSDQMVARCDLALGRTQTGEAPADAPAPADAAPPEAELGEDVEVEDAGLPPEPAPQAVEAGPVLLDAPPLAPREEPAPAELAPEESTPEESTHPLAPASSPAPDALPPLDLGAEPPPAAPEAKGGGEGQLDDLPTYASRHALAVPTADPFGVTPDLVVVHVLPAVRVRLAGLLAVRGAVEAEPEVKRFRGRPTEKPFGTGAARLHLVRGEGSLLFAPGERRFTAVRLREAAFLREEALFALTGELAFENGRVTSTGDDELNLVQLRGEGAVLLSTRGKPRTLEVRPGAPLRLPLEALVGWLGAVTPRVLALVEGGPAELAGVELTGEGQVLVDPGPGDGDPT